MTYKISQLMLMKCKSSDGYLQAAPYTVAKLIKNVLVFFEHFE